MATRQAPPINAVHTTKAAMVEALSPLISLEEMALITALCASCPATRSGAIPTDRATGGTLVDSRKAPGVDQAGLKGNEGQIDRSVGSLTPLKLGEMVGFFYLGWSEKGRTVLH